MRKFNVFSSKRYNRKRSVNDSIDSMVLSILLAVILLSVIISGFIINSPKI